VNAEPCHRVVTDATVITLSIPNLTGDTYSMAAAVLLLHFRRSLSITSITVGQPSGADFEATPSAGETYSWLLFPPPAKPRRQRPGAFHPHPLRRPHPSRSCQREPRGGAPPKARYYNFTRRITLSQPVLYGCLHHPVGYARSDIWSRRRSVRCQFSEALSTGILQARARAPASVRRTIGANGRIDDDDNDPCDRSPSAATTDSVIETGGVPPSSPSTHTGRDLGQS